MLLAGFAVLFAGTASKQVFAQTAASAPADNEQAVQLSEFDVSAEPTHGFQASESLAATRVNTPIIELPYSTVNLTHEFFDTFGINVLDESTTQIGGLTGVNIGGNFSLRGFSSTSQLRDGFYRLGRYGISNISTVEVIRGSEAGIYGRTSPGGIVNMVSIQPSKTPEQQFFVMQGGYAQQQVRLFLTGAIDKAEKTYYVVSLDQTQRRYEGQFSRVRSPELFLGVKHDFSDSSHIKFSAEYYLQIQHSYSTITDIAPLVSVTRTADVVPAGTVDPTKNIATTHAIGLDIPLARVNPFGPSSELNRGEIFYELAYDKEFSPVFSMHIGAYNFRARRWDYNNNVWAAITIPATGAVTDTRSSTTTMSRIQEDGGGTQMDFVAHYPLANGAIDNKTLVTIDLNDYYRWDPNFNYAANTNPNVVAWAAAGSGRVVPLVPGGGSAATYYVPTPGVPIAYFTAPGYDWTQNPVLNTLTRRRTTSVGGNLSQQIFLLNKRLILFGGLRNDNVLFSQRDYTVQFASVGFTNLPAGTGGAGQPGGSVLRRYFHENKDNMGFNYTVLGDPNGDGLHLYGSYSQSYFVDQTSRPAVIASTGFKPQVANGEDYGIKGIFFNGALSFTVGGYYAEQFNVASSDEVLNVATGTIGPATNNDGNQTDKGIEADVNWQPTPSLNFLVSAGTVDSRYTNFGTQFPEVIGRHVQNVAPYNGSFTGTYNFGNGPLKGLNLAATASFVGAVDNQSPTAGDTTALNPATGKFVVTGHTDAWDIKNPSFVNYIFAVHYTLPEVVHGYKQTLGVIVNNPFDRSNYLRTSGVYQDQRNFEFTYTLTHSGSFY